MSRPVEESPPTAALEPRRSALVGALIGVGVMAAVDEIVFHQILAWHLSAYDAAWVGAGLLLVTAGLVILLRSRRVLAADGPASSASAP